MVRGRLRVRRGRFGQHPPAHRHPVNGVVPEVVVVDGLERFPELERLGPAFPVLRLVPAGRRHQFLLGLAHLQRRVRRQRLRLVSVRNFRQLPA